jgi:hypothetical protein
MKFKLDWETVDGLVRCSIKEHMSILETNIKKLQKKKKLKDYEQEDLKFDLIMLEHMSKVHHYFNKE